MDDNNRNFLMAMALSVAVLIMWQVFYAGPKMRQEQERAQKDQEISQSTPGTPPTVSQTPNAPSTPTAPSAQPHGLPEISGRSLVQSRDAVIAATQRAPIDTPALKGSINLKGGRIDDLVLKRYHVTVDKSSDNITLLSPSGTPDAYYIEQGWLAQNGDGTKLPNADTEWEQKSSGPLTPSSPLILQYDNGGGLIFRRTISVDENYMFTVKREVENKTGKPVTLYPFSLLSRHSQPKTTHFFILHEGLVGVLGDEGLQKINYKDALEDNPASFKAKGGWLGITDKYWAAVLIPDQEKTYEARMSGNKQGSKETFQTDYLLDPITITAGSIGTVQDRVFAGAKQVHTVDGYGNKLGIDRFELLIDWGWFYFLTKPLFFALDFFYKLVGNFGISILIVTLFIKLLLFPLANKAYVSMSKMKKLQPEVEKLRERYTDDKVKLQQAMMELYKKEKVNPVSGCLPIIVQIPVFFSLYKVLFVSIDMRHAPFFGWIQDLSAPDPTSVFNLFGAIPWDPPSYLLIGIWPIIMGITMWVQMKLNPAQPDPVQQQIFAWMPVVFTVLLASFPAGLVIYWAWNNFLSIVQQWTIMRRQGVEVDLLENMGLSKFFGKGGGSGGQKSKET